jgi:hypothetical protein
MQSSSGHVVSTSYLLPVRISRIMTQNQTVTLTFRFPALKEIPLCILTSSFQHEEENGLILLTWRQTAARKHDQEGNARKAKSGY